MIRFTLADLERENAAWGCNCGPAALAAICGLTLEEARKHFGAWLGHTNLNTMYRALDSVGIRYVIEREVHRVRPAWPRYGIARIQFEGPWMEPDVPAAARYQRTHWVGSGPLYGQDRKPVPGEVCVWDINAVDTRVDGWCLLSYWTSTIAPALAASYKRATGGWRITHAIEVEQR